MEGLVYVEILMLNIDARVMEASWPSGSGFWWGGAGVLIRMWRVDGIRSGDQHMQGAQGIFRCGLWAWCRGTRRNSGEKASMSQTALSNIA